MYSKFVSELLVFEAERWHQLLKVGLPYVVDLTRACRVSILAAMEGTVDFNGWIRVDVILSGTAGRVLDIITEKRF